MSTEEIEEKALAELKSHPLLLPFDFPLHPGYLLRWLRARDNDVDKAAELLANSLAWRRKNIPPTLKTLKLPPVFPQKYPRAIATNTIQGHPVITCPFGIWDVPFTVATEENTELFRQYTWQGVELIMEAIEKAGDEVTQCVVIIDMAGFSFMSLLNVYAVQNGLALLGEYEANYPETLHSAFLLNSSPSISMLLNLVKSALAQRTYDKIKVLGTDVNEWKEELCKIIDLAELPVEYGGEKEEIEEGQEVDSDEEFVEALETLEI